MDKGVTLLLTEATDFAYNKKNANRSGVKQRLNWTYN